MPISQSLGVLLKGLEAVLELVTHSFTAATLPTKSVPVLTPGDAPDSYQQDEDRRPDWRLAVDWAVGVSENDGRIKAAVGAIAHNLPQNVRDAEIAPLAYGPDDAAGRAFCGFCELALENGLDLTAPDKSAETIEPAAKQALQALAAFCETQSFRSLFCIPITAVRLADEKPLTIERNVRLIPVDDEGRGAIWKLVGGEPTQVARTHINVIEVIECEAMIQIENDLRLDRVGVDWSASQETGQRIVRALRLLGDANIQEVAGWQHLPDHAVFLKRLTIDGGFVFPGDHAVRRDDGPITPAQDSLCTVYKHLQDAEGWAGDEKHAFDLAIRRLDQTYGKRSDEDRIIDSWVAFETLFVRENDELSYRAQMRIARFVADTLSQRELVRDQLRESYGFRSKIVHGTRSKKLTGEAVHRVAEGTVSTLREALRRWIDPSHDGTIESLDRALLS